MESLPEFSVSPERDHQHIPTGRWCWDVFDAATQGPIQSGVELSREMANIVGFNVRNMTEERFYMEGSGNGTRNSS